MNTLLAYHGKQTVKNKYLKRVKAHYKADEIIHGIYWENGKGCAVGCTIHGNDHKRYETELGIPESIALLEDKIFEGLPNGEAKEFPLRFLDAIKPGADLSKVTLKFKIWLLVDKHNGVIKYANEETKKIIKEIVRLQKQELKGKEVDYLAAESAAWSARSAAWSARSAAWSARSARSAAWSAARSAAWSAAESAESAARSARSAAESAAESAESAARSAAESAAESAESAAESAESAAESAESAARSARSAAESAAWSAAYKAQAEKLLELLAECE